MKTRVLVAICAVLLLSAGEIFAGEKENSSDFSADNNTPKSIACAQERGETLGQCSYRVKWDDDGKITVTVVFANGFKRQLFFKNGEFLKASVTMSGVGTDTDWNLKDATHMIRVDGQRYEVPDSLIAGN